MLSKSCSAPALGSLMISAPHSEALRGGSDVDFSPPIWTPWKLVCKSPRCARFAPRCLKPKDGGLEGRLPGSQRFTRAQSENNLVHSRPDRMACYPDLDEVTEEESDDLEVSDNPAESAVPNYHNSMPNAQMQLAAENSINSIPNAQIQLAEKSLPNIQIQSWGSHSMQKSYRESINDRKRGIMQPIHMIIATVDCGKDGNLSIPGRVSRNSAMADGEMYSIVGAGSNGGSKARHVSEAELEDGLGNGKGGGKGMPVCGGGGGGGGGSGAESNKTDIYYQKMLEANPGNPLLLRNYAKFLHEVQHDMRKAEEYYGRAILASPEDGDVLSLYAKLIWEGHQDPSRAKAYFDRAVQAAPDDCYVLASYAHFLWNSKDEEEEEDPDPRYNVLGQSFVGSASVATC